MVTLKVNLAELGEARVLYFSWQMISTEKRKDWLIKRLTRAEKVYGAGAGNRIKEMMTQLRLQSEALQTIPPFKN